MGRDPNEPRSKGGNSRRRVKPTRTADWVECDADVLRNAIATVALQGGALRLGYTSDGGAYAIGVYGDGDPYTDYVKPDEDITDYMQRMIGSWET